MERWSSSWTPFAALEPNGADAGAVALGAVEDEQLVAGDADRSAWCHVVVPDVAIDQVHYRGATRRRHHDGPVPDLQRRVTGLVQRRLPGGLSGTRVDAGKGRLSPAHSTGVSSVSEQPAVAASSAAMANTLRDKRHAPFDVATHHDVPAEGLDAGFEEVASPTLR